MRIISGTARGRRLFTPGGKSGGAEIRPTADRVREAIFNIIADRVAGAFVLDLFAGTGALALEALSRGAESATFVDFGPAAIRLINRNIELCGFSEQATLVRRDLLKNLHFLDKLAPAEGFDLVFADPPYRRKISEKILEQLGESGLLRDDGLIIMEEASEVALPERAGGLAMSDRRIYGDTAIFFYNKIRIRERI